MEADTGLHGEMPAACHMAFEKYLETKIRVIPCFNCPTKHRQADMHNWRNKQPLSNQKILQQELVNAV